LFYRLDKTKSLIDNRLVFYTIFVDDEAIFPNIRAFSDEDDDNKDIGCILGARVPPPRTINSLKRAICRSEQIADADAFDLYGTAEDDEALNEDRKLSLSSAQYPGADPAEPIVLVNKRSSQVDVGMRPILLRTNTTDQLSHVVCGSGLYIDLLLLNTRSLT
jgi:hypothetical protein